MHPLAFDKEGRPFQFSPQTRSLLVRRFRKPGERGTCEAIFDDDGDPLQVGPDCTVAEFRAAVRNVPALYRLDQLDEDGNEIDKNAAAYVAIDPARNGVGSGSSDPLVVIRDLALGHADVAKTLADRNAGMVQAATENMRVGVAGGLGNRRLMRLLMGAATEVEDQDDEDDRDDEDGEDNRNDGDGLPAAPAPASPMDPMALFALVAPMIKPMLPKIGEALGNKLSDWLNTFMAAGPAAGASSTTATASAPASGPASSGASASGPAAGQGAAPTPSPSEPQPPPAGSPAQHPTPDTRASSSSSTSSRDTAAPADHDSPAGDTTTALATTATTGRAPEVRNGMLTGAQIHHLFSIRALLTPQEVQVVDEMIARIDAATRATWLAQLMALPVDEAAVLVRTQLPKLKPPKAPRTSDGAGKE